MSWLQLEFSVGSDGLDELEALLLDLGALAITLASDADEEVLEPDPGATPLWNVIRLRALFELQADLAALRRRLSAYPAYDVQFVGDQDWQSYARTFAVERVFANRLLLTPPGGETPSDDLVRLELEPGLAFGSGSHPTTCLCLEWLAAHIRPGQRVLDFGCGSGILAIGAALLGARVVAVDHDDQAVAATTENAMLNGVEPVNLEVHGSKSWGKLRHGLNFDVVVANILAKPLIALAHELTEALPTDGQLVLSGLLTHQAEEVMAAYEHIDFDEPVIEEQWVCLHGRRR